MCEIAVPQSFNDWDRKCRRWIRKQYFRCVLGVKIYSLRATRNTTGQLDRCMIARLWTRQTALSLRHTVRRQPEWNS
ncbi:15043_t:CDS:2, partial [Funneliformis geosporum]